MSGTGSTSGKTPDYRSRFLVRVNAIFLDEPCRLILIVSGNTERRFPMDDQTASSLITTLAFAVFACSAWATLWIWRARVSGWAKLAAAYPAEKKPDAGARRWNTVRMLPSGLRYPRIVSVRLTVDGLYLVPTLVCRFGHDPILIPWEDIEITAVETYPADRLYDLRFPREPGVRLRVGVKIAQYIRRAADNSRYFAEPTSQVRVASKPSLMPIRQKTAV